MNAETRFFLAWLRAHAPRSSVLCYFEFPPLPVLDRRRSERRPADPMRRAHLEHARRVVAILEARS